MLDITWAGGILVVAGELDLTTVANFRHSLEQAMRGDDPVTVDMSGITFISSTGIHALLEVVRSGHELAVRNPSAPVRRVLELSGAADFVDIVD